MDPDTDIDIDIEIDGIGIGIAPIAESAESPQPDGRQRCKKPL